MFDCDSNLRSFIKVYKNSIDEFLCQEVLNSLKSVEYKKHKFYNSSKNIYYSLEDDLDITYSVIPQYEVLMETVWNTIRKYVLEDFNFEYFSGWNGFSNIRFNRYNIDTHMNKHVDHIRDLFDGEVKGIPLLSIVGLLNDDFEGGDFVMYDNDVVDLKQGDILIFPSNFLYPHRVNKISKGTRYSFVSWAW